MKRTLSLAILLPCILFIQNQSAFAQLAPRLTESATISIITFGPYQNELYSAFGHSGIRVQDSLLGINWMYDYGRFDFEQENFYWNFARGKMLYSIGKAYDFNRYKNYYISQNRYIKEQVLNLKPEEVQIFLEYLENNYLPENRDYLYNYVYDNCASRIRDVTQNAISDPVILSTDYVVPGKTVRDLMHDYLSYQPWGELIIDMGLGKQIDGEAPAEVYMFLPDYIFEAFANGSIQREGYTESLVKQTNYIYQSRPEEIANGLFTPFNVFLLLFFAVGLVTNRNFKTLKRTHWIDVVLFTVVGIFGWWFVFLWFGTDHLSKYNWNLIWAFPFHIPFVYFLKNERYRPFLARFYRYTAIVMALALVCWAFMPQPLHQALVPLVLTLILRSFYISYDLGRLQTRSISNK